MYVIDYDNFGCMTELVQLIGSWNYKELNTTISQLLPLKAVDG